MNYISGRDGDGVSPQASQIQKQKPTSVRPKQPPMPKAKALELTQKLKSGLVVASILCFGSLGGFILSHTSVATAAQTTTKQATTQTPTSSQTPSTSSSSSTSSSQQGGGYGFGTSSSTSIPVSGSSTS